MKKVFLLLTLLVLVGCNVDKKKEDDKPELVPNPVNPDPTTYTWKVNGNSSAKLNQCVGPYSVSSNIALQRNVFLSLEKQNSITMKFYSNSVCTDEIDDLEVEEGRKETNSFYIKNTADKISELAILLVYLEGSSAALVLFPVNFQGTFNLEL